MLRTLLAIVIVVAGALVLERQGFAQEVVTYQLIVNVKNPATALEKRFVSDAFLRKRTQWGDESAIKPVDLNAKHPVRAKFSSAIHGRSTDAVRRYWAQLVFSGAGIAPPSLASESAVVEYVSKYAGAIGYVSKGTDLGKATKVVQVK